MPQTETQEEEELGQVNLLKEGSTPTHTSGHAKHGTRHQTEQEHPTDAHGREAARCAHPTVTSATELSSAEFHPSTTHNACGLKPHLCPPCHPRSWLETKRAHEQ